MKSRISIDLDYYNKPIINIEYRESDDLRDKVVKRFLEEFGHNSNFCRVNWQIRENDINQAVNISPISPAQLEDSYHDMKVQLNSYSPIEKAATKKLAKEE